MITKYLAFIWKYGVTCLLMYTATHSLAVLYSQRANQSHHAVTIHGKPKYPATFKNFDYVNPNAPKNGKVVLGALGGYDNLNTFIIKGESAAGVDLIYNTLLISSLDEKSVAYGLLAERVYYDNSRTWVAFKIRSNARWHDGKPVTVDDVIWTFNILIEKGIPTYRLYYQNVKSVRKVANNTVRFEFARANQELPLILGQLAVLPKHYWQGRDFSKTTLDPPLGSGPYKIKTVRPGKFIVYERVRNYWGDNLPSQRGYNNFNEIRYDYYKSLEILREALRSGRIDFFQENNSKEWATGYDIDVVKKKLLNKVLISHNIPQGVQGFIFNTRKKIFQDKRVREAIGYAFDFEWSNKVLFYGAYTRASSYFNNSILMAKGVPSKEELKLLNAYKNKLPAELFTQPFKLPQTDGSGNNRANLRKAATLLKNAGWVVKNNVLVNAKTDEPLDFTITIVLPAFERVVAPFIQNLKKLGIQAKIKVLNTAQYENTINNFDFDMVVGTFGQSDSPGNEQRDFWSTAAAKTKGSRNIIGITNPAIDDLIEKLISTTSRSSLITHAKALDRILLWNHYIIPQWYIDKFRLIYWDRFGIPTQRPPYAVGFNTWWIDNKKETALKKKFSLNR
ncbi:uncharacterized protein YejA [Spirochaetota bacterium]|nr:uncharacterized protein YejA [Spirochaetota bacterium]